MGVRHVKLKADIRFEQFALDVKKHVEWKSLPEFVLVCFVCTLHLGTKQVDWCCFYFVDGCYVHSCIQRIACPRHRASLLDLELAHQEFVKREVVCLF